MSVKALRESIQAMVDNLKVGERLVCKTDDGAEFSYINHPEHGVYLESFKPAGAVEGEVPTMTVTITPVEGKT